MLDEWSLRFQAVQAASEFPHTTFALHCNAHEQRAAMRFCTLFSGQLKGLDRSEALQTVEYVEKEFLTRSKALCAFERHGQSTTISLPSSLRSDSGTVVIFAPAGLCKRSESSYRYFRQAMLFSDKFVYSIRMRHDRWLSELSRGTPSNRWPEIAAPRWVCADDKGIGQDEHLEGFLPGADGSW